MDKQNIPKLIERAEEVVKDWLEIDKFIEDNKSTIFRRVEQCWLALQKIPDIDLRRRQWFFTELTPFVNAIIQVASTPAALKKSLDRAMKEIKNLNYADPASYLSVYTLYYIIFKECEELEKFKKASKEERQRHWFSLSEERRLNKTCEEEYWKEREKMCKCLKAWTYEDKQI